MRVPMTLKGEKMLHEELEELKFVKRPQISKAIGEAREHGDLKENAEYHAAREQQGFIEARIKDIEYKVSMAQVIDVRNFKDNDKIVFGATVELINISNDENVTYQIVGEDEADVKHNKISYNSPLSRSLIGKTIGDELEVKVADNVIEYEVVSVKYR